MFKSHPTSAYILSIIILGLAVIASVGGILIDNLYRDNVLVASGWFGNDLVTLLLASPIFLAALIFARRGSPRWQLIWLGMLSFMFYNFAFYLFGTAFNRFFLIYVALFTFSMLALIFALVKLDVHAVPGKFSNKTPVKIISGYMLFVALGLGAVETGQSLQFVFTGELPPVIQNVGHPTSIVFALDLSFVVPFFLLDAVWLWQRRPWGYLLGVILNVKGAVYMIVLTATSVSVVNAGFPDAGGQIPIWGSLATGSVIASFLLLKNIRNT